MNKTLLYLGIGLLCVIAIVSGAWLGLNYKTQPFVQLPGLYECEGFGVPENSFNKIEVSSEFKIISTNDEGVRFLVGELRNYDGLRGRIELTTEAAHYPNLTLEPIEMNFLKGTVRGVYFIKLTDGPEKAIAFCKLLQKLEPTL